jgi:predicted deacetylase
LKEYDCVEVKYHKDVDKAIEQWQKNGWRLHTYTRPQYRIGGDVHHHLLFEKGEKD